MMGLHFALRGGVEHIRLRRPGCTEGSQIRFERDCEGNECMVYREDPLQKNNQGGITGKTKPKIVYVYPVKDSKRCPVYIVKKYVGLLPDSKSTGGLPIFLNLINGIAISPGAKARFRAVSKLYALKLGLRES